MILAPSNVDGTASRLPVLLRRLCRLGSIRPVAQFDPWSEDRAGRWCVTALVYYRVLIVDREHHLLRTEEVDCLDDNAACEAAALVSGGEMWELWCGAERISLGRGSHHVPTEPEASELRIGVALTRQ